MKIICQKCHQPISNDFNHTLEFCTNCGAPLKVAAGETVVMPAPAQARFPLKQVILTGFFTAFFLAIIAFAAFLGYRSLSAGEPSTAGSSGRSNPNGSGTPAPRTEPIKRKSDVPAADILEVKYSKWAHAGSLSGPGGWVDSEGISFSSDLSAHKYKEKNYDAGDDKDTVTRYLGKTNASDFAELAETVVNYDFTNIPDSNDRISEHDAYLIVVYGGGEEKKILTSTGDGDFPEVKEILRVIRKLETASEWTPAD